MTLVPLGDCIDDMPAHRGDGLHPKAPSTLGTFLRSFRWGHVRQLDRVQTRRSPSTSIPPSARPNARHHGYTGKRGYHPLLPADVPAANTARGAAHVGRVRYAGANGRLTLRADSGFYTHGVVSVCRKMDVRFSISPSASTRACAISSRRYQRMPGLPFPTGWTAPPMWPRPPALPSRVNLTPHRCGSSSGV